MLDLVSQACCWKQYTLDTHKHIFHILAKDDSIISTYTKEELDTFILDHIIKVTKYPEGENLKIKVNFDSQDDFDVLSMYSLCNKTVILR